MRNFLIGLSLVIMSVIGLEFGIDYSLSAREEFTLKDKLVAACKGAALMNNESLMYEGFYVFNDTEGNRFIKESLGDYFSSYVIHYYDLDRSDNLVYRYYRSDSLGVKRTDASVQMVTVGSKKKVNKLPLVLTDKVKTSGVTENQEQFASQSLGAVKPPCVVLEGKGKQDYYNHSGSGSTEKSAVRVVIYQVDNKVWGIVP